MIVSKTPNRSNSRWLQACALLFAFVVLPLGVTYAQDYDAVSKRLTKAVKKGELTLEQAGAMMRALRAVSDEVNLPTFGGQSVKHDCAHLGPLECRSGNGAEP